MKHKFMTFVFFFRHLWSKFLVMQNLSERKKFSGVEWLFYATENLEENFKGEHKRLIKRSKIVMLIFCFILILGVIASSLTPPLEEQLKREDYGGKAKRVELNVKVNYSDYCLNQNVGLVVLPQELTVAEEEKRISQSIDFLRGVILGKNKGFSQIVENLNLILYDDENGVSISWESSMPQYINAQGEVQFLTLTKRERVVLTAHLTIGKSERRHSFVVFLTPLSGADFTRDINRHLEAATSVLNRNKEGEQLILPSEDEAGVMFEWSLRNQRPPLFLIPVCFFVLAFLYFSCHDSLIKESQKRKAAIEEEIPNLALQLILLLNAGLVVPAAFQEILAQNKENKNLLYAILEKLSSQSNQSNESFIKLFYSFAQKSGNRNLIRLLTLVSDHETKGSALAEKLQRERDILWESRLQGAKAKAKEAETKLCFPLMLLLLVLVTISIAPALLEL